MRKAEKTLEAEKKRNRGTATWIIYAVFAVIVLLAYSIYTQQVNMKKAAALKHVQLIEQYEQRLAEKNSILGLPETYPQDFIPLYPGVELLEASVGEAKADDGTPMDKWHVLSQTDDEKQSVYDFYLKRLEEENMRQTMYISLPTGYSLGYADENRIAEFRIEKLSKDPKLQVEITLYVVKGKPASNKPIETILDQQE